MAKVSVTARVLKSLGVFGSVEMLNMACAVIRTKLVAIFIGSAGVGVISLYNSTLDMIRSVGMLNLRQTAVREIVGAPESQRPELCRITHLTSLWLGIILCVGVALCSPLLSMATFGTFDYSWGFALLSLTMFASAVADGRKAILQSLGRLKELAKATTAGVITSTLLALPMYWLWGMAAIVPVIMIFSFVSLGFLMLPRIKKPVMEPMPERVREVRQVLLKLGAYITGAIAIGFLAEYLLRIWLNSRAGVQGVGIFQAGYTIINSYVGVVFTAIAMEFYPRLSAVRTRTATSLTVAHEITVALWVLMPVVVVFLCCDELIVRILYSSDFLEVLPYLTFAIGATQLRAVSWCFSYVIVARGDGRVYLFTEGVSAVSLLVLSYLGWVYGGYAGLGLAYAGQFVVFAIATGYVYSRHYGLYLPPRVLALIAASVVVAALGVGLRLMVGWWAPALLLPFLLPFTFKFLRR